MANFDRTRPCLLHLVVASATLLAATTGFAQELDTVELDLVAPSAAVAQGDSVLLTATAEVSGSLTLSSLEVSQPVWLRAVPDSATFVVERGFERFEYPAVAADNGAVASLVPAGLDGAATTIALGAGDRLSVRWLSVAGAEPQESRRVSAKLVDLLGGFEERSVELAVADGGFFTDGLVLARVFCDDNADGIQQSGERGLPAARVVLDTGWVAVSDLDGDLHFDRVRPGAHAIELDEASLPGASTPIGAGGQILDVALGLGAATVFPVACDFEFRDDPEVSPLDLAEAAAVERYRATTFPFFVDPSRDFVSVGRVDLPFEVATLSVGGVTDVAVGPADSVTLSPVSSFDGHWVIETIDAVSGDPVALTSGDGAPPEAFEWTPPTAPGGVVPAAVYAVRLRVFSDAASVETVPVVIRVTGSAPGAAWEETLRGDFFVDGLPSTEFDTLVSTIASAYAELPDGMVLADVHIDDDEVREDELDVTRAQAMELQFALIERGIPADRVVVGGRGSDMPLAPNVGMRNRNINRRVEVVIETALGRTSEPPAFALQPAAASLRVNERLLADAAIGEPTRLDRPTDNVVIVERTAADGARSALRLPLADLSIVAPAPAPEAAPEAAPPEPTDAPAVPTDESPFVAPPAPAPTTGPFSPVSGLPFLLVRPLSAPSVPGQPAAPVAPGDDFSPIPAAYDALFGAPLEPQALQDLLARVDAAKAGELSVYVPEDGMVWQGLTVPIFGDTAETNRVFVNGVEVNVDHGRFAAAVPLDSTSTEIVVETRDADGFRGLLRVPVTTAASRVSIVAIGDLAFGSAGAVPSGRERNDSLTDRGSAAVYVTARAFVEGSFDTSSALGGVFEETGIRAHVDTDRLDHPDAIEQVAVLPMRGELIVDGSEPRRDLTSDWPIAVDVFSGDSSLRVGNARVEYDGVDAFRYERTLTGARVDLDERWDDGTRIEFGAHAGSADDDGATRRALLRGTGGSVYFLEASPVREGSEHVEIVVVDALTGVEVLRRSLRRNDDYTLEPLTGRVVLSAPLPSTLDDGATAHAIVGTRSVANGHRVYLSVGYESTESLNASTAPWGLSLRQTVLDIVTFGGGIVREGTDDGGEYSLASASLELGNTPRTSAALEFATSDSTGAQTRFSPDGGFVWREMRDASRPTRQSGDALAARASLELADIVQTNRDRLVLASGYFRSRDEGFSAWGDELVARDAWGTRLELVPRESSTIVVRHDNSLRDVDGLPDSAELVAGTVQQDLTAFEWLYNLDRASVALGFEHGNYDDSRTLGVYNTDVVGGAIHYDIGGVVRVGVRQEVVARGDDPRLLRGTDLDVGETRVEDRFITALTAETELPGGVTLDVAERFRYSGENHASIGLRAKARDGADLYLRQSLARYRDNHGTVPSFVIGSGQSSDDGSARSWGEYQIGDAVSPWRTQTLLGHGRSFAPTDWLGLDVAYEHSEILAGPSSDASGTRDAGHLGFRAGDSDVALFSGFAEVRLESAGPIYPSSEPCYGDDISLNAAYCVDRPELIGDRRTIAAEPALLVQITPSLASLTRVFASTTYNETLGVVERREVEGSTGLTYRPQTTSRVVVVSRFTHIDRAQRLGVGDLQTTGHRENALSLAPAFQLASRAWLTPRIAWRGMRTEAPSGGYVRNAATLTGLRLAWRATDSWEAATEYRFLTESLSGGWAHGALLEGAWILDDVLRVGLGYNFARFTADELGDLGRDGSGFFVRLTGRY